MREKSVPFERNITSLKQAFSAKYGQFAYSDAMTLSVSSFNQQSLLYQTKPSGEEIEITEDESGKIISGKIIKPARADNSADLSGGTKTTQTG